MPTDLHRLSQTYTTYTDTSTTTSESSIGIALLLVYLAILVFLLAAMAKLYMKAGRKWWEAIIPIYNLYVQLKIIGRPGWWLALYFIPIVNFVVAIINTIDLAKAFGRGIGTGLLLLFFPFIMLPLMAFSSKYQYKGPVAEEEKATPDTTGPQPPTHTEPAPSAPENQNPLR